MALNLHKIAGNALTIVNDWTTMVFTTSHVIWSRESRDPVETTDTFTVQGKIQPANSQDLHELGVNLAEYEYFKCHLSGTPTQMNRMRQLGCDLFVANGYKYKIVGKMPWDDGGWRKFFCYRIEFVGATDETE